MDISGIAILAATALAMFFPAYCIDAIRAADEKQASDSKAKACLVFGILVFITLVLINS